MIRDLAYYNGQARLRRVKDWHEREAMRQALWRHIHVVGAEEFIINQENEIARLRAVIDEQNGNMAIRNGIVERLRADKDITIDALRESEGELAELRAENERLKDELSMKRSEVNMLRAAAPAPSPGHHNPENW